MMIDVVQVVVIDMVIYEEEMVSYVEKENEIYEVK